MSEFLTAADFEDNLLALAEASKRAKESRIKATTLLKFQADLVEKMASLNEEEDAMISFSAAGRRFIVPAIEVISIHDIQGLTPVPAVKPWMLGVSSISGEVCTVTDFSQFINGKPIDLHSSSAKLIIPRWDHRTAILVEKVYHLIPQDSIHKIADGDIKHDWCGDIYADEEGKQVGIEIGFQALLADVDFLNASIDTTEVIE